MGKGKGEKEKEKKIPVIDLCSPSSVEQMPLQRISGRSTNGSPGVVGLSSRRAIRKCSNINQKKKLDTHKFQLYLEKMWKEVPEHKKKSHVYLDCLWFHLYNKKRSDKPKVLKWIVQKNIFSWNYVFVPIVCWHHWSLLILCNLSEDLMAGEPCMLLLDSLGKTNAKFLETQIRKFLCDIYKGASGLEEMEQIQKIPLLMPKVMKQRNNDECGIFVLYFIHLFLRDDLEKFRVSEVDQYFVKEVWHDYEQQKIFSQKLSQLNDSVYVRTPGLYQFMIHLRIDFASGSVLFDMTDSLVAFPKSCTLVLLLSSQLCTESEAKVCLCT
ncbi:hypothetical protein H6P81_012431 [Aristolochia fimbriata]|uniref:Ubiquitin-like protease family profile domain-containing protein n=1 Tax=Aristolochia fimbriata TaxID=158543 RepID=A0AAV7EBW3_ARIFI|nr:hypothetical protein H6P81_012431 [Aristolochia fimbriata]